MKPIPSTAEILAFKMLDRSVDEIWTNWAYDMLAAGFETESLVILAGERGLYNQFEMQSLADKVFVELGLTWDNPELVYKNYICYLVSQAIDGKRNVISVLGALMKIYYKGYEDLLHDFAMLYWAKDDLSYSDNQYYWPGATRDNIDAIIEGYFREWKAGCG